MEKPAAQRQKEYLARLKAKNNDDYLKKDRETKRSRLQKLKNEQDNYNVFADGQTKKKTSIWCKKQKGMKNSFVL